MPALNCEYKPSKKTKNLLHYIASYVIISFVGRTVQREPLAQAVEHLTFNQGVDGSSPSWLTKISVAPWSSGLRHRPFTAVTRVRIP